MRTYPRRLIPKQPADRDPDGLILAVWLRCPICRYSWHAATIDPEAWWGPA